MTKKVRAPLTIRQGDVGLVQASALPEGSKLISGQENKIVLAWGEVTGHHHRIEDHIADHVSASAREIADAVIARARMWETPAGDRFLEVRETVSLSHEEHATIQIPPGIYEMPIQVEHSVANAPRRVAD